MANHLDNMMNTTMENIRQMVDVNTIIGEPVICPDGTVIIPVFSGNFNDMLHGWTHFRLDFRQDE